MGLTLTFYTKPNCSLCDHALEEIELARAKISFELVEVNILENPEVYERYKQAIPVLAVDEKEVFRFRITAEELIKKLTEIVDCG